MQYIICKWKIYLALLKKRERDPRECPFKRNMVASDPDGMIKALGSGDAFLRGVLCNFLVCLAVWMAAASKRAEGKVIALFFPILLFVLCGYEHCIANLYYLPAGAFAAAEYGMETTLTLAGCLKNLAAVTLGNLVGGAALGVGYRFAYLKE